MMPTDCSVLCTITILSNIRISRELSRFYAHIEFRSSSKYDAYGLFRAAHYHNPTQYSHIAGISRFYAHIEAGPKVFHPLMSKLMCVKDLLTLAS